MFQEDNKSESTATEQEEDDPWSVTDLVDKTVPWKGNNYETQNEKQFHLVVNNYVTHVCLE